MVFAQNIYEDLLLFPTSILISQKSTFLWATRVIWKFRDMQLSDMLNYLQISAKTCLQEFGHHIWYKISSMISL